MDANKELLENSKWLIGRICECKDEFTLHKLLHDILPPFGIKSYIYTIVLTTDGLVDRKTYRFLIGCAPELCQMYIARKWFMNDPYIEYASTNSAVISCDDICLESEGQQELRETTRSFGFRSGIIAPAHNGGHLFGVLFLGSDMEPEQGHPLLMQHRITFRTISMELLEWWSLHLKKHVIQKFDLSPKEIAILKLLNREYRASDIARELNVSPKTIHNHVRTIKDKFGTNSVGAAVKKAASYGLLS